VTRVGLAVLALLALAAPARAHVGSPNVFFQGEAGRHAVHVVIRPPATLPGVAQVDVRAGGGELAGVRVRAEFADASAEASPPAVDAIRVAGDTDLWSAGVWLLRRGAYGIEIVLDSSKGGGRVVVPLQAAALARPVMPPALGAALAGLGALLVLFALAIAHGAARGGPRARAAAPLAALALAAALAAGKLRWDAMDRNLGNALYKPLPVEATVDAAGTATLLRLSAVESGPGSSWDTLVTDHGKLVHLFLLRAPGLDAFAHLHPVRRDARTFEGVLPPLPEGRYELYAELTHESGATETLVGRVELPAPSGGALAVGAEDPNGVWCLSPSAPAGDAAQPSALDFDDSWHASRTSAKRESPLMGGGRMVFAPDAELFADRDVALRFAVSGPDGAPAALAPYMGMLGHAVVRRSDGGVFTHLHPVGTISMAAAELLARRDGSAPSARAVEPPAPTHEVVFPYAFPQPGRYRVWVQVRTAPGGGVVTGVFDLDVRPS
jgi:hypothetical protein